MSANIYFRDGSTAIIASAIDAEPFIEGGTPDNLMIELRNSSQRVALVPVEVVKYIEIVP